MPSTSRQHRSPDGQWRVCSAKKRGCKFAEHRGGADGGASAVNTTFAPTHTTHAAAPPLPFELLGPEQNLWRKWEAEIKLAPAGMTGKFCHACDTYLTPAAWAQLDESDSVRCECGEWLTGNDESVDFRTDELRYLDDEQVRTAHWFHLSEHEDWDEGTKAEGLYTHLGSKEAAMERLLALRAQQWRAEADDTQYYLHEVQLNAQVSVAPGVYHDQVHGWPEYTRKTSKNTRAKVELGNHGVLRYMNQYEGPGTVSLIANPQTYSLVASVPVPLS